MDIFVRSLHDVQTRTLPCKCAVISVVNRFDADADILDKDNAVAILRMRFDDILPSTGDFGVFNDDDAKKIWKFVDDWHNKVDGIVVHCIMGVSRSAAVAAALAKKHDKMSWHHFFCDPLHPNRHVFKVMNDNAP